MFDRTRIVRAPSRITRSVGIPIIDASATSPRRVTKENTRDPSARQSKVTTFAPPLVCTCRGACASVGASPALYKQHVGVGNNGTMAARPVSQTSLEAARVQGHVERARCIPGVARVATRMCARHIKYTCRRTMMVSHDSRQDRVWRRPYHATHTPS